MASKQSANASEESQIPLHRDIAPLSPLPHGKPTLSHHQGLLPAVATATTAPRTTFRTVSGFAGIATSPQRCARLIVSKRQRAISVTPKQLGALLHFLVNSGGKEKFYLKARPVEDSAFWSNHQGRVGSNCGGTARRPRRYNRARSTAYHPWFIGNQEKPLHTAPQLVNKPRHLAAAGSIAIRWSRKLHLRPERHRSRTRSSASPRPQRG
jgi:hypothetical protein